MDTVPRGVIECAILDGQIPQCGDGAAWCEQHGSCYRCAKDIHDTMVEEIRRLKAERDRALAELDKALGEREDAMLSERNAAYNAGYDEGFASADDWYAEHAAELAEHGWIRLPHDRNGKLIRVGDKVMDVSDKWHNTFEVNGFLLNFDYKWSVCGEDIDAEPKDLIHNHVPTIEDTLRELIDRWLSTPHDSERELFAEYAEKLRLADE